MYYIVLIIMFQITSLAYASQECPNLFNGKYILPAPDATTIGPNGEISREWATFNVFQAPTMWDYKREGIILLKNYPFEIQQVGCEKIDVTFKRLPWFGPIGGRLTLSSLITEKDSFSLKALVYEIDPALLVPLPHPVSEVIKWNRYSVTINAKFNHAMFNSAIFGGAYKITLTKRDDGSIHVQHRETVRYVPFPDEELDENQNVVTQPATRLPITKTSTNWYVLKPIP